MTGLLSQKNSIYIALFLLIGAILLSIGFIFYNRHVIMVNTNLKLQSEAVTQEMSNCFDQPMRHMDVSLRGFALIHEDRFLYMAPDSIESALEKSFIRLDSLLTLQGYQSETGRQHLDTYHQTIRKYCVQHKAMIALIRQDSMSAFLTEFSKDNGKAVSEVYNYVLEDLTAFERELNQQAQLNYEAALTNNLYVQLFLFIFGVPTLIFVIIRLRRESANRNQLIHNLEQNNRKYLFDSGTDDLTLDAGQAIEKSIDNFKRASAFIKNISQGNYQIQWQGMTPENIPLNQDTLAGELLKMKEQMEKAKAEDDKRNWTNEGLARFSELVRNHQSDLEGLANQVLRFLTKYLNAQQGSLFTLEEEDVNPYLNLRACYAFDRKKFVEKRIELGSGLVGQTYLEGQTILLTQIPQGYTSITSGLGDATPECLVIVPLKYNDRVEAVLELASFDQWETYQIEFIEKAGEFVASAILTVKTAERTERLLRDSQTQAEVLKAQEEELRQNMEEMAATQEEMERKERELAQRLQQTHTYS